MAHPQPLRRGQEKRRHVLSITHKLLGQPLESCRDSKWVRKVVKSRPARRPYTGLSALDGKMDVYLGLSPQAGMGRTVGA
jgi:hypothetical protein